MTFFLLSALKISLFVFHQFYYDGPRCGGFFKFVCFYPALHRSDLRNFSAIISWNIASHPLFHPLLGLSKGHHCLSQLLSPETRDPSLTLPFPSTPVLTPNLFYSTSQSLKFLFIYWLVYHVPSPPECSYHESRVFVFALLLMSFWLSNKMSKVSSIISVFHMSVLRLRESK